MKKILLATVAVAALTGSAFAATMKTTGEVSFKVDGSDGADQVNDAANVADVTATTGYAVDNNDTTDLEMWVEVSLETNVSDTTKDGLSWAANWDLEFGQQDVQGRAFSGTTSPLTGNGNGTVTVDSAWVEVSSAIGALRMGDTSANVLNDAADNLYTSNLSETVAVRYSNSIAGFGVKLAADDANNSQWGVTYGMGGLDFGATGYDNNGSTYYAAGVSLSFAGFDIELGTNSDNSTGFQFGYTMAGIGLTLAGDNTGDTSGLKTIEASYDIADGLSASVTYDVSAEAVSEAGVTVKF